VGNSLVPLSQEEQGAKEKSPPKTKKKKGRFLKETQ
jgi:hypothetical protein